MVTERSDSHFASRRDFATSRCERDQLRQRQPSRAIAMLSLIATPPGYHPDAVKACASLNTSAKLGLMRGYGEIDT